MTELSQELLGGRREASENWEYARDGDKSCLALNRRHYSARRYKTERQPLFVGPGRKIVLLSKDGSAMLVWRIFIDGCQPKQEGANCAIFRNEGKVLSSTLIREAVDVVWQDWGRTRVYTLVNPKKIKSTNPGCCFVRAGWRKCGTSKTGKMILELLPSQKVDSSPLA